MLLINVLCESGDARCQCLHSNGGIGCTPSPLMRMRAADYPRPPSVSAASAGDQCMVNVYQLARSCQACQPLLVRPNPTLRAPWDAACRRTAAPGDERADCRPLSHFQGLLPRRALMRTSPR